MGSFTPGFCIVAAASSSDTSSDVANILSPSKCGPGRAPNLFAERLVAIFEIIAALALEHIVGLPPARIRRQAVVANVVVVFVTIEQRAQDRGLARHRARPLPLLLSLFGRGRLRRRIGPGFYLELGLCGCLCGGLWLGFGGLLLGGDGPAAPR